MGNEYHLSTTGTSAVSDVSADRRLIQERPPHCWSSVGSNPTISTDHKHALAGHIVDKYTV